jgi:hypothetical protein
VEGFCTNLLGPHTHDVRCWIVSQLRHRVRPGHTHDRNPSATSSHPPLNYQQNRTRHFLVLARSQQHHGPTMDRERRPRLLYPSLRSQSYQPLYQKSHRRSLSPVTSHSRISWEIRFPCTQLGDKDPRHIHPRPHSILSPNPRPPKEGRGRENRNGLRLCSNFTSRTVYSAVDRMA